MLLVISSPDEIIVNPEWPEDNREFFVFKSHELKSVLSPDSEKHGYYVLLPIDPRLLFDPANHDVKMYTARVYVDANDNSNEMRIKVPAWMIGTTFICRSDRESWAKKIESSLLSSMDNASKNYKKSVDVPKKHRFFKTFRLLFPDGHKLSSKEVNEDAGEKEDIPPKVVGIWTKDAKWKSPVLKHFVVWKVARVDTKGFMRGEDDDSPTRKKGANAGLMDDLAGDFAGMNTGDSDSDH